MLGALLFKIASRAGVLRNILFQQSQHVFGQLACQRGSKFRFQRQSKLIDISDGEVLEVKVVP